MRWKQFNIIGQVVIIKDMLTVSIHPVDVAHRQIAVQLATFIPLTSLSWSAWFWRWPSRRSSWGRFSISPSCFQAFFPQPVVVGSCRNDAPRQTPPFLFGFCFFFFLLSLHLRLIKIMSLNRTKWADQSATATTWGKTVMSDRFSNQSGVVGTHRPPITLYGNRGVPFLRPIKCRRC